MKKTPKDEVKDRFETKEALVDELMGLLESDEDEPRDEWKARLLKAPSSKLLRLHRRGTEVQERFGGRGELLDALCALKFAGRQVEEGWRAKAAGWSDGRLLDLHRGEECRARRAEA